MNYVASQFIEIKILGTMINASESRVFSEPKSKEESQQISRILPISALNLKNPGPITSLLESYTASTA